MKVIELRPDRSLLRSNFDGYKLSLEPVPLLRQELSDQCCPDRVKPTGDDNYSCLHAQLFGLQNHLVRDPWTSGSCYYVDRSCTVRRVQYCDDEGRLKPVSSVFKIVRKRERVDGDYNCSLVFISERLALVGDGQSGLRIVETGDRKRGDEWKGKFGYECEELPEGGMILLDGRFEVVVGGERQIHAVCASIRRDESCFRTVLRWFKIVQSDASNEWKYHSLRVLEGRGFPWYCSLEVKSTGLVMISDKPFSFVSDSETPFERKEAEQNGTKPQENETTETILFTWSQTVGDLTIKIPKEEGFSYRITNDNMILKVVRNETVVLDGESFYAKVDPELTSWTNETNELQITLFKANNSFWPFLFPGSPEESDPQRTEQDEEQLPVSNITSQLEDCDFGIGGEEKEYVLERLDLATHEATHKALLGSNAPLFNVTLRSGFPAAVALRNDVDACVWLQQPGATDWSLRHEGTLHAFGYVQASKQQRKFLACAPDMSYGIICEPERHVFIYKSSYGIGASGLRNRSGPQVTIGQQKLITLPEGTGEILGTSIENEYTILLTESHVLLLQLCIEE
ncbi:nudC domain-containing protein 1 [Uranotaenia lowii]|uniref:nudC domain-containing protein 1 n=1 Tax=Uranotaenia lowii TaxID=190385 RepID=UPI002479205D|nr:nudC domain-containing protein 1 [Uranotaenia lowii]